jgi:hypothetical protein
MELDSSIEYPSDSDTSFTLGSDSSLTDSSNSPNEDAIKEDYFYSVYNDPDYFDQQPNNCFSRSNHPDSAFIPPWGEPCDFDDQGEFMGIQTELPWWHPKSAADYAIYNYVFHSKVPHPDTGIIHELEEECPTLDLCAICEPDAWADLMKKVEIEFPTEFEGPRDPMYYQEWYLYGQPSPETYGDEVSVAMEDYPELLDNKHPKEVPRCI